MTTSPIPVCLPKLPTAEQIFPYLSQIDANRWYTNFGPLVKEFLSRMAALFGVSPQEVVSGTNGTLLLELCLKAFHVPPRSLCIVPAWTFAATPLAAAAANLIPFFVDVDLETQALDPEKLLNELPHLATKGKIGAVIVVAPFGKPINVSAWDKFTDLTGIPVIIDAAAAFDTILQRPEMRVSRTPMMISLHATKVFGIGEGGLILSTNQELLLHIENLTQFGFPRGIRSAHFLGTNAKLNEYIAAVGLASLDNWIHTRTNWLTLAHDYQAALNKANILHMLSAEWATSTCNIILPQQANSIAALLNKAGIQTRKWWEDGCHHMPAFHSSQKTDLPNTEYLQKSVLGLPFYQGLPTKQIQHMVSLLEKTHALCEQT
jgi:dTDP-4-amino-4,6-dideoxygalactose transaminase